jgi:hypothetical protein
LFLLEISGGYLIDSFSKKLSMPPYEKFLKFFVLELEGTSKVDEIGAVEGKLKKGRTSSLGYSSESLRGAVNDLNNS